MERREALKKLALGMAASQIPLLGQSCSLVGSPSLTEGPYFVDEDVSRSDIRVDSADGSVQAGYPLSLTLNVSQLKDCVKVPLSGAYVDIWHCNALGVYSDTGSQGTTGKKFLRGYQPTDRHGNAYFLTIYPGWYNGRTVHIHVKVRVFSGVSETYEFTTQLFFDEAFTSEVFQQAPYNTRTNRDTLNTSDGIYRGASSTGSITAESGSYLMLQATKRASWAEAQANLICDLSLGSSPDQSGNGGPAGGGPGGPPPGGTPGTPPPGGIPGFPPPGGTPPGA